MSKRKKRQRIKAPPAKLLKLHTLEQCEKYLLESEGLTEEKVSELKAKISELYAKRIQH